MPAIALLDYNPQAHQLNLAGEWTHAFVPQIEKNFKKITFPSSGQLKINGQGIVQLDMAGAWMIKKILNILSRKGCEPILEGFSDHQQRLLDFVFQKLKTEKPLMEPMALNWVSELGRYALQLYDEFCDYLTFIGYLTYEAIRVFFNPKHFRFNAIATTIQLAGCHALAIIGLLSFLIGVVLAYQMGLQLKNYGANVFIVDLLGFSVLREFGPLITAIMVAGRTGASFTAQLGTMKVNQEIDALNVMGVTPAELLLLPKIIGLFIALPLLAMWADIFGVLGGMIMAHNMLDIGLVDFLARFRQQIPLRAFLIGIGKAPVFALIIASIGCFQGMRVEQNADSVGKLTTRSVVLSIFFIIVVDAVFSIILSKLKL